MARRGGSSKNIVERDWGHYEVLFEDENFTVKRLTILPGKATSVQFHRGRQETWVHPTGHVEVIPEYTVHQIHNSSSAPKTLIEVWTGEIRDEGDIERLLDVSLWTH